MHSLAVFGITGRMGQSLVQALRETPTLRLSGAIASRQSNRLGQDAAEQGAATGVTITADVTQGLKGAAVAADFSTGACVAAHAGARRQRDSAPDRRHRIRPGEPRSRGAGSPVIPVLVAANTSVGVSVVRQLVSMAAAKLGPAFDAEILRPITA
jgi:4-hydroxy-tetrahydrodipicolinate reductase